MKHKIQVRRAGVVINIISPELWAENCGNFNPVFCTYRGKRRLVKSEAGDLSDPFRRDNSYLKSLYIDI